MANIPTMSKVAVVPMFIGGVLHLIGFASPFWLVARSVNSGLWKSCVEFRDKEVCGNILDSSNVPGWLRATQFFETIGLILIGAAGLLLLLTFFITSFRDKKIIPILNAVLCFAATGCILLGVIIYGSQDGYKDYLGWAFALCIVGAILVGMAGACLIVGAIASKRS